MAIGDPWDTAYNPNYQNTLKNQHTGMSVWMPDNSDQVPQDDPLSLKDRRKGRFCSEGCGCVDTYCDNLAGSRCVLPPELAVTIFRGPDGRYDARAAIAGGKGETFHLKYSNGAWRGSRCCSHNADGSLGYACDPCKVTTLPNGKPSNCHYANNKYDTIDSNHQKNDGFERRGEYNYEQALTGEMWPRRGVDAWLKPKGYNQSLTAENIDLLQNSKIVDGVQVNEVKSSATPFSSNVANTRLNIKSKERRIYLDKSGYVVGYAIDNGYKPDAEVSDTEINYLVNAEASEAGCIEDGAVPIKKRPWCRDPITGYRMQQQCSDTQYKNKEDCEAAVDEDGNKTETWLYGDKTTCEAAGVCESPEEKGVSRSDRKVGGIAAKDTCEAGFKDGDAKCQDVENEDVSEKNKDDCEEEGHIWKENKFFSNDWVDWEYERRSCCGGTILDEAHPFHTPQISGTAANTRKNTVCFTPYSEVILRPSAVTGFVGPQMGTQGSCTSSGNQADRDWFFSDTSSYWTLLIRPCNFWGSCYEEGVKRKDPAEVANSEGPDNYYETTCGEEVMLYIPVDQFISCSNFNLTLSQNEGLRSGWSESQAMWNPSMGNPMGNPAGTQTMAAGWPKTGAVYGLKGLPGDAIEKEQYSWWCDYPDAGWDGYADGGECQRYIYWNSNDGKFTGELQNPKGVDALYAFNLQPQPFKATEEKQSRAKTMKQASDEKTYWQMCVDHKIRWNGGGHWFWEYGPDYFFYHDFALWDEIGFTGKPGSARYPYVKPGGKCEAISDKAQAWIDGHIGQLTRGSCGSPPLWVGWQSQSPLTKICPDCYATDEKAKCGVVGTCEGEGGEFSQGEESECSEGTWKSCCEWIEGCTIDGEVGGIPAKIITNYEEFLGGADPEERDPENKEECEKAKDEGGADGKWYEQCITIQARVDELDDCPPLERIPDEFLQIVLGEEVGTCVLHEEGDDGKPKDVSQKQVTKSECETEQQKDKYIKDDNLNTPSFKVDIVGSSDVSYPVREGDAVKLSKAGPQTTQLADVSGIEDGKRSGDYDVTQWGLTRNRRLPAGSETGHSLSYWHNTGLYPRGEFASFVNDHCMGTTSGKRIEYASNTKPIKITSRNHLLRDGDLVNTYGVNGNFAANVLYQKDWKETQWEDKLYSACVGEGCDEPMWPDSVCPNSTECRDKDGKVLDKDKYECGHGNCSKKKSNGDTCEHAADCEADAVADKAQDANGDCPEGFTKVKGKGPYEAGGCVSEEGGCGGTWNGAEGNTFTTFCDEDKFYACSGQVIKGKAPPPAEFFVVKNVTIDTFDLYTCDKHPVDGRITKKNNLDNTECPDDGKMVCVKDADVPYNQVITAAKFSVTPNPFNGIPSIVDYTPRCVDLDGAETGQEEKDCTGEDRNWITERNLSDNPKTEKVEGEAFCSTYGSCKIIDNYWGMTKSFMTFEECITVAKTYDEWHLDKGANDKDQRYVNRCTDLDGNLDNSVDVVKGSAKESEAACIKKHSKCIDHSGEEAGGDAESCARMGNTWKTPTFKRVYSECVDTDFIDSDEDKAFKNCWDAARWMSESLMDQSLLQGLAGGAGKPNVDVWKVCPFTGDWILWNNHEDVGVEAGYIGHLGQNEIDGMYRFGLGGPGYKWEDRANDYYVQIEQKGICPVCCDTFMPENLTATLTGESSEILNFLECGLDPCTADPSMTMKPRYDGYCCSDGNHHCNLIDLPDCEAKPENFGRCVKEGSKHPLIAYTKETCKKRGGTFTPIKDLEEFTSENPSDDCDMFLRKRPTYGGSTNCRKCSDVYSSRHKVPLYTDENDLAPLGFDGQPCCTEERMCDCTRNDQDKSLQSPTHPYPDCKTVRAIIGDCGSKENPIGTERQVGEVKAVCKEIDTGSSTVILEWIFTPCTCFPNKLPMKCEGEQVYDVAGGTCHIEGGKTDEGGSVYYDNKAGCYKPDGNGGEVLVDGKALNPDGAEESDCDTSSGEYWKDGATGCGTFDIKASADESCFNHNKAAKPVEETCPGLGTLDVPMKYDGVVWRSDWVLMNTVGTHHCDLEDKGYGVHRFKWHENCRWDGGASLGDAPPFVASKELVAVGADCDACDMSQAGMAGVFVDALKSLRHYKEVKPPSLPQDGHFIRLVMGCGQTIPSIDAYKTGRVLDGGFTGGSQRYDDNGMQIWAEITNCTFVDLNASETLRVNRSTTGTSGSAPCFPGITQCTSKKSVVGDWTRPIQAGEDSKKIIYRQPSPEERKYTFAGRCMSPVDCGPKGPCVDTECCTYTGMDMPFFLTGPLWSGAVACSQGGDIQHKCHSYGFDPLPQRPAEQLTVHYVKDVDPVTGSATLVVPAYPPTFGGVRCSYPNGTLVGIGLAELAQAENDTMGGYSRSNKSRNPYLPAGGTVLTGAITRIGDEPTVHENGIPRGDLPVDEKGDKGRGSEQFMEIKVANIAPLITKNPRKNRHLRIFDRSRPVSDDEGNPTDQTENAKNLEDMNMMLRYDLPQPYGLNPWPVDHQTHSDNISGKWPKGIPMGPRNTESLRLDPAGSLNQPGRVGPKPTVNNLNRMFRYTEEAMGDGTTTPIPELYSVEPVMINEFHNVYSEEESEGICTGSSKNKKDCEKAGDIWVPNFLYTKVVTEMDNDLSDGEKIVISGSVVYPATCKGARMGFCKGARGLNINECMEGECVDTHLGAGSKWIKDSDGNIIKDRSTCMNMSMQKQMEYEEKKITVPSLIFKTKGEWVQMFEEGTPESSDTSASEGGYTAEKVGTGDRYVCEEVFGGKWVVGTVNDEMEGSKYKDPLNLKPKPLEEKEKDFVEGCPIGCKLNGFYLKDPCEPPSDDNPQGQCFECVQVITKDSDGNETEEMRCPLGPADGNYVARKRGCQHSDYSTKLDCENAGWAWFGEIANKKKEFALHSELQLDIHDASKLRSNLIKPDPIQGVATDWEYDLSNTPKRVTTDGGFTGASDPISGLTKHECNSIADQVAWSSKGCVDLSRLDVEFPNYFGDAAEPTTGEIYQLCSKSNNCHFIKEYSHCMDSSDTANGTCIEDGEEKSSTKQACGGVFIGPVLARDSVESCLEANGGSVVHKFTCEDSDGSVVEARTTSECTDVKNGTVNYIGKPHTISQDKDKMNLITRQEELLKLSSPEAIAMGHEVGVGTAKRRFTGVIYANQIDEKENEGFSKVYADPPWRAVWSRHGGSFDIIVGYPAPENNCRQGNSDKPVNMDFYMTFPSICCNDRGPLNFWACGERCYHHYNGPHLEPLDLRYGTEGTSAMKVNIHE